MLLGSNNNWSVMRFLFLIFGICLFSFPINAFEINDKLQSISQLSSQEQLLEYQQLLNQSDLTPSERFSVLNAFAIYQLSNNQLTIALTYANDALTLANSSGLDRQQAIAEKLIGIVHYYQGEHNKALKHYQLALSYFQQSNEAIEQANILNNMALVQNALGQHQTALKSYLTAEPLYMKHGSEYDAVDLRANMAGLYISLRRFDAAIELLNSAIEYYQQHDHQQDLARAKAELGVALKYSEQLPQALIELSDALNYYQQVDDKYSIAATLHNIAEVHLLMDLPQKGQAYAGQGILFSRESGHNKALIGNLHALAKSQFWQGEYIEAQFAVDEALQLAEKLDYNTSLTSLLMLNALVKSALKQPKKAIRDMHDFQTLERNRFNSELNLLLSESETEQLKHKLEIIKHKNELQTQLSHNKTLEERYLFAGFVVFLGIMFLLYKRLRDSQLNKELSLQVETQTQALRKANQQLTQLSLVDALTEVHNRRCFDKDIKALWQEYRNVDINFTLWFIDIDHFKKFNDTFGHIKGDHMLKSVSAVLKASISDSDRVYRYGGEEFAILLTQLENNNEDNNAMFSKIQTNLKSLVSAKHENTVTVSAGVCSTLECLDSLDAMVALADERLYQAKKLGRNQLVTD